MFRRFWLGWVIATAPAAVVPPVGKLWASDTLVELKQAIAAANTAMPVWRDVDVALVECGKGFISLASAGKFRVGGRYAAHAWWLGAFCSLLWSLFLAVAAQSWLAAVVILKFEVRMGAAQLCCLPSQSA